VSHDRLWAPWRLEYVTGDSSNAPPQPEPLEWQPNSNESCFLCRAAAIYESAAEIDRRLHVVDRTKCAIVVLNRFPYNNGHLLISPLRHVGELSLMSDEEHLACVEFLNKFTAIYREKLHPDGFNVGLNLGRVAGAGLPGHLHWHLVPRWSGDNNFMPVLAGTRVIPQSLDALWELLTAPSEPK
jgi:ATP adenylyltransferase